MVAQQLFSISPRVAEIQGATSAADVRSSSEIAGPDMGLNGGSRYLDLMCTLGIDLNTLGHLEHVRRWPATRKRQTPWGIKIL